MPSIIVTLGLGFLLGLKHATEADHLAAVSTIVSERRSVWQSAVVGGLWGIGHTAALLAGGVFVLLAGVAIPERAANLLELSVAVMIIFLGTRLLRVHVHSHAHEGSSHVHVHFRDDSHESTTHNGLSGWRPLIVGIVHGLAGSAALTLLVLTQVVRDEGVALGIVYLLVFGAGSIGGMLVMSSLIGLPFSFGFRFLQRALIPLRLITAALSTTFGIVYAWQMLGKLFT